MSTTTADIKLTTSDELLLCTACGAQYEEDEAAGKSECRICEVCNSMLFLQQNIFDGYHSMPLAEKQKKA